MTTPFPDWNDFRDILLIAEAGTLSAAARNAGVSQSTMSRRLSAIEAGGQPVFLRDESGRMTPNQRGAEIVAAARDMAAIHARAAARLTDAPAPLRIVASSVTAKLFLEAGLPNWAARADTPATVSLIDDLVALDPRSHDILVAPMDAVPERSAGQCLGVMEWGLFASHAYLADHPHDRRLAGLPGHKVIRASGALAATRAFRWLAEKGGSVAMLSANPVAMQEACASGAGIALLPDALAEGDSRLRRLDAPVCAPTEVWMIADADQATHPRIAGFLRWARGQFRSAPPRQRAG
jgi:DNA-binding transcriptional LysR family regulator